jgi:hypothetical protein
MRLASSPDTRDPRPTNPTTSAFASLRPARRFWEFPTLAATLATAAVAVFSACSTAPAPTAEPQDGGSTATATATDTATNTESTAAAASAPAGSAPAAFSPRPGTAASATPARTARGGLFGDRTQPGLGTPTPAEKSPISRGQGSVVVGSVNVYTFNPPESFTPVDPATTSLAQVLADMGEESIEWYQHVMTLSNPWFEGRVPGSDGIEHAANYLEFWMTRLGLEPAFAAAAPSGDAASGAAPANPWRQPFDLPGRERRVKGGTLSIGGEAVDASLARPMQNTGGGEMVGPIAFLGYGIESGKDGYTSFAADQRLDGRIAIVMRGEPLDAEGKSAWGGARMTSASSLAAKFDAIKRRGANGIILTDAPGFSGRRTDLSAMSAEALGGWIGVPVFHAENEVVDRIVRAADPEGRDLAALRAVADLPAQSGAILGREDATVHLKASVGMDGIVAHNVGGVLRGRGVLANEWIVIGAHYDHVGYGAYGADPKNRGKLHPGADDNASGTAALLMTAKRLKEAYGAAPADQELRSVLFLAFDAEEMGLNGARHFVRNASIPADKVDVMLNMDMVGRIRDNTLVVGGVESAVGFRAALEPMFVDSGLKVFADPSGRAPSDHAPFFGAGIPVLFFFGGVHDIYHQPGDQGYTVDPRGIPALLDLVERIAWWRATSAEMLQFSGPNARARAAAPAPAAAETAPAPVVVDTAPGGNDRGYAPVRLGIQPAMAEDGESGIIVESVSPGTSAADGGIKPGDILLKWNGDSLGSIQDMMAKLRASKPGDVAKLTVFRDGKETVLDVELKASTAPRRPQDD